MFRIFPDTRGRGGRKKVKAPLPKKYWGRSYL
jgi:hypothetical protein